MRLQAAETVDLKRSHHKVDLAIIMLREVSQTEKGEDPMLSHTWDTDLKATDRTDRQRCGDVGSRPGVTRGEGDGEVDGVKGVRDMATERNLATGCSHSVLCVCRCWIIRWKVTGFR